jgi:hypothetical protein
MRHPYPLVQPTGNTIGGRTEWRLLQSFSLKVPLGRGEFTWYIPEGETTDFASVPTLLMWLISPTDPHIIAAALIHDDLYKQGRATAITTSNGDHEHVTPSVTSRFMADAWFRDVMELYGCPLWKRICAYYAVRMFGWIAYRSSK